MLRSIRAARGWSDHVDGRDWAAWSGQYYLCNLVSVWSISALATHRMAIRGCGSGYHPRKCLRLAAHATVQVSDDLAPGLDRRRKSGARMRHLPRLGRIPVDLRADIPFPDIAIARSCKLLYLTGRGRTHARTIEADLGGFSSLHDPKATNPKRLARPGSSRACEPLRVRY